MTVDDVLARLEKLGSAQTKKTLARHGAKEPFFGVKIGDMKPIVKEIRANHALALGLYDSGNSDAMYFAGLIAEPDKMMKRDLERWVKHAYWYMLGEFTVAWVAAEGRFGWELGLKWIDSRTQNTAAAGWSTLSCVLALKDDPDLDLDEIRTLLDRIARTIRDQPGRVRYAMNNFVISVGTYVAPLLDAALATAKRLGKVDVDMGETECKIPDATEYIEKVRRMGRVGKKRKTVRC